MATQVTERERALLATLCAFDFIPGILTLFAYQSKFFVWLLVAHGIAYLVILWRLDNAKGYFEAWSYARDRLYGRKSTFVSTFELISRQPSFWAAVIGWVLVLIFVTPQFPGTGWDKATILTLSGFTYGVIMFTPSMTIWVNWLYFDELPNIPQKISKRKK